MMKWLLVVLAIIKPFINAEEDCYGELGCFSCDAPWTSVSRPVPKPWEPSDINTKLYLCTRNSKGEFHVELWPKINLNGSDFDPNRSETVFICHGFASSSETPWMSEMKDAYLKKTDANVFIVDWGQGAQYINYLQVASNTRIVGAEVARFLGYLIREYHLNPKDCHLIGHSLGAHIMSYCSKIIRDKEEINPTKQHIGKLTALDPAQPCFDGEPEKVRLDKTDCAHVVACHTSARPLATLGFGMITAVCHVDMFINGGMIQPGCLEFPYTELKKNFFPLDNDNSSDYTINSVMDLLRVPVEILAKWVACSHGRAIKYYIAGLLNESPNCTIVGHLSELPRDNMSPTLLQPVTSSVTNCTIDTCIPFPSDPEVHPARGVFNADTTSEPPYCGKGDGNEMFAKYISRGLEKPKKVVTSIKDTILSTASKLNPFAHLG